MLVVLIVVLDQVLDGVAMEIGRYHGVVAGAGARGIGHRPSFRGHTTYRRGLPRRRGQTHITGYGYVCYQGASRARNIRWGSEKSGRAPRAPPYLNVGTDA